jgi:hypothetical protein
LYNDENSNAVDVDRPGGSVTSQIVVKRAQKTIRLLKMSVGHASSGNHYHHTIVYRDAGTDA